jgi:hypothetical protein
MAVAVEPASDKERRSMLIYCEDHRDVAATERRRTLGARIRSEYLEMPGMVLTAAQVRRLCGAEQADVDDVLRTLVASGFLRVWNGTYVRADSGRLAA